MSSQMTADELRRELSAHLDTVSPPPGDLSAVRRRSRRLRTRRFAGPGLLAAAAVGVGALVLAPNGPAGTGPAEDATPADDATGGPVDLSQGLRAFASYEDRIYLAGRSLPYTVDDLDTDAAATPYGIVYYDDGIPTLLRPDGSRAPLSDEAETTEGWHPTAKVDASRPVVVFARLDDPEVVLTAYDLDKGKVVATVDMTCEEDCSDLVIDAVDSGAVFVRTPQGTHVWDYERRESYAFAGPGTRVADARNHVVLYDGAAPTEQLPGWRYVPGKIDAELSFDGAHVLYWSDRLEPTLPNGDVIRLDLPVKAVFFTFDTDGSVLAATASDPSKVFDCEIPSGACEPIGEMPSPHGDPMFVGNDM